MLNTKVILNWRHALALLLCSSLHRGLAQQVITDGGGDQGDGHQETYDKVSIHTCPAGFAMMGANVSHNVFLCIRVISSTDTATLNKQLSQSVTEHKFQLSDGKTSMLGCPNNMYMRGLQNGQNILVCSKIPFSVEGTVFDYNGASQGQAYNFDGHICPKLAIMVGIQNSQNNFACGMPDATYTGFPKAVAQKAKKKLK